MNARESRLPYVHISDFQNVLMWKKTCMTEIRFITNVLLRSQTLKGTLATNQTKLDNLKVDLQNVEFKKYQSWGVEVVGEVWGLACRQTEPGYFDFQAFLYLLSCIFHLPSYILYLQSHIFCLVSSIFNLPSSIFYLLPSMFYLLSSIFNLLSSIF